MTVAELIERLQSDYSPDAIVLPILWDEDDIKSSAEHLENLSTKDCNIIMNYIDETWNTGDGINSESIINAHAECVSQGLIE